MHVRPKFHTWVECLQEQMLKDFEETQKQELLTTKKVKQKWTKFCSKHKNDIVDCQLKKVERNYTLSNDIAVVIEMGMNKMDRLNWHKKYFSNVLMVNKIDNYDCNYNYNSNYNYENSRGCYLFDMIGTNVFIDVVCKKFLYPMDILNLFVLSKHIRYNLVNYDNKYNFMKKLFDEHSMVNYWMEFLVSLSEYQKLDERKLSIYRFILGHTYYTYAVCEHINVLHTLICIISYYVFLI